MSSMIVFTVRSSSVAAMQVLRQTLMNAVTVIKWLQKETVQKVFLKLVTNFLIYFYRHVFLEVPKEIHVSDISEQDNCEPACQRGDKCCANQCYDKHQDLCCNGTIVSNVGLQNQCCGSIAIDSATQVCCNGVPHDRQGITWCCGTESFSPLNDKCCNQVVVPRSIGCNTPSTTAASTEAAINTTPAAA